MSHESNLSVAIRDADCLVLDDDWRHAVDPAVCAHEGHLAVVTTSRFWVWRRWWLRCWRCELRLGPWRMRSTAEAARRLFERRLYLPRHEEAE